MGYARHYRDLVDEGYVKGPKRFGEIRAITDSEAALATFLTPWMRKAEWHLRAVTVKHFCRFQRAGGGYLDPTNWSTSTPKSERLQITMLNDILRHGEPYTADAIRKAANDQGVDIPKWCHPNNREETIALTEDLPFWAVIDSFTVGTLGKFLRFCGAPPGGSEPLNDSVARDLAVPKRAFNKVVQCFGVTRNLVFHHQRLWMRPLPISPGISRELERRYAGDKFRTTNKQAHFIALAGISQLLPFDERELYLNELDTELKKSELFELGIKAPPFFQFLPKNEATSSNGRN